MSYMQAHMRTQIFIFLMRMALFTSIGVVLHNTQSSMVMKDCPGLWESMLAILVIKCVRMVICSTVVKLLHNGTTHKELKYISLLNLSIDAIFFITEIVMTSRSLDSKQCVESAGVPFNGHPMIAYVNGLVCVWDGSFILAHVLFLMLGF